MKEKYAGVRDVTVCSRSPHAASELRKAPDVFFARETVSSLTSCTASAVRGVGRHKFHVLVQSRIRLQLMQVFQLVERSMRDR